MRILRSMTFVAAALFTACPSDPVVNPLPPPPPAVTLQSIMLSAPSLMIRKDEISLFSARGSYSDGTTKLLTSGVTWASSDTSVATVDSTGLATALAAGSTEISATFENVTGRATLTVIPAALVSLAIQPGSATIEPGATQTFIARATFDDQSTGDVSGSVTWSTSNEAIATVAGGIATGVGLGMVTISASDATTMISATATLVVRVEPPVEVIVNSPAATLPIGLTAQLNAIARFADNSTIDVTNTISWESSAPERATVSATGLVTALTEGFVSIAAVHESGVRGVATIRIAPPAIIGITVSPPAAMGTITIRQEFEATAHYSDGVDRNVSGVVVWTSSDPAIATISNATGSEGEATALSLGTVTITATDVMSGQQGTATFTVVPPDLVSVLVFPETPSVPAGLTVQLDAFGLYSDNTGANLTNMVVWSSSDPAIATVDQNGLVTAHAIGTVTISALEPIAMISSDDSQDSSVVTVDPPILISIEVSPPAAAMVIGSAQAFTATGHFSDGVDQNLTISVQWQSSSNAVVSLSPIGLATANAIGMATISARDLSSGISSNDSNQSATVLVSAANLVSIAVMPSTSTVPPGADVQLTALGTYDNAAVVDLTSLVAWSSADPAVASISNANGARGVVSTLTAGQTTVTAREPITGISSDTTSQSARIVVPSGVSLQSVAINGPATVDVNQSVQFTASGTYDDMSVHPMTHSVMWTSQFPAIATISNSEGARGRVNGISVGSTNITATNPIWMLTSPSRSILVERSIQIADIVHYELEEGMGNVATNLAPNRPNGTINGTFSWGSPGVTAGMSNFRLTMADGGTNNVNSNLPLTTYTNLTIEFWWRFGSGINLAYMWNSDSTFRAFTNGVAFAGIFVRNTPGGTDVIYSPSVQTGAWHHIAYVLDASAGQGRLYINGVQSGSTTYSGSISLSNWFLLGQNSTNGAAVDYDRYRIWGQALTAAQIGEILVGDR